MIVEYGWNTVAEYEEDELADGSEDEKRLYKTELRAGRKVKATKQKLRKISLIGYGGQGGSPSPAVHGPQLSSSIGSKPSGSKTWKPRAHVSNVASMA